MKQNKIVQAYKATEVLSSSDKLNTAILWILYELRKTLSPHVEFQLEREKALRDKYSEFTDEEGKITGQPYIDYLNELEELSNLEKDLGDITKVKVKIQDGMGITVHMMEALEDFIEFIPPDK